MAVCGVLLMAAKFAGVENYPVMIASCLLYAVANAFYWQLMPSMIYDVCEVDELMSGEKRSGTVISLQALSESLSIAVGLQMLGVILEMAGFDSEAAVQPDTALEWVENAFVLIPGAAMMAVALIMRKFPMTKEVFERVKDALEKREKGENPDVTQLTEIFR